MKVILAFAAILGLAAADDLSDIKAILACFDKAMRDGLPSVDIAPYDPLEMQNYTDVADIYPVRMELSLFNNTLYGMLNYTLPVLDVNETTSNPDTVTYHYAIHWPLLTITGIWEYNFEYFYYPLEHDVGTFNMVLENVTWSGIFNLTKPGQEGYNETVNDFTITSVVENIVVKATSIGDGASTFEGLVGAMLNETLNDFPHNYSDDIRTSRFNEYWIGHPEKIRAVMDHCGLSN